MPSPYDMNSPEQERRDVILRHSRAVDLLVMSMDKRFIPSSGGNIAYAIRGARTMRDVAAVPGGIILEYGRCHPSGPGAFGTTEEISRIVLTVMKFDPAMRSAALIRYSKEALDLLEDIALGCCGIDRTKAPPGISTMDWGIASCCSDGVPEAIYDCGTQRAEGLIYLIGEDVARVADNIIILSHRIQ